MRTYHQATALCLATMLMACSVRDSYDRAKQIRTYADMQTITTKIEQLRSSSPGPLKDTQVQSILENVAEGRDAWGHRFVFRSRVVATGFSYVLVSYGKDGKPDVSSQDAYFTLPESRIQGDVWKDIVFRNGVPVVNAGK